MENEKKHWWSDIGFTKEEQGIFLLDCICRQAISTAESYEKAGCDENAQHYWKMAAGYSGELLSLMEDQRTALARKKGQS